MNNFKLQYRFLATPWQYAAQGGWVFVSLPKKLSIEIRRVFIKDEQGWGRLSVTAKIGHTQWSTAIWLDSKMNTYLLPLKAEIRKKEKIEAGKKITVVVFI